MSTRQRTDLSRALRRQLLLQRAKVTTGGNYAAGGREKQPHNKPKPVTLPKLRALSRKDEEDWR